MFEDDEGQVSVTANEVIIVDDEPEYTGLVDQYENGIYNVKDKHPIGFYLNV